MTVDITQVLIALIAAVAGLMAPIIRAKLGQMREQVGADRWQALLGAAAVAVQAAEQLYGANDGDAKKSAAIDWVQAILDARGIKVDAAAIESAIEYNVGLYFPSETGSPDGPSFTESAPAPFSVVTTDAA